MLLGKRIADVVEEQLVEIVATELRVAVTGLDLDDAVFDLGQGDVERSASQVIDQEPLHLGRMRVISQHGGGRLVDDSDNVQPGQTAGLSGGLPLAVVEEGGDRDDGLRDRSPQLLFGALFQASSG